MVIQEVWTEMKIKLSIQVRVGHIMTKSWWWEISIVHCRWLANHYQRVTAAESGGQRWKMRLFEEKATRQIWHSRQKMWLVGARGMRQNLSHWTWDTSLKKFTKTGSEFQSQRGANYIWTVQSLAMAHCLYVYPSLGLADLGEGGK